MLLLNALDVRSSLVGEKICPSGLWFGERNNDMTKSQSRTAAENIVHKRSILSSGRVVFVNFDLRKS